MTRLRRSMSNSRKRRSSNLRPFRALANAVLSGRRFHLLRSLRIPQGAPAGYRLGRRRGRPENWQRYEEATCARPAGRPHRPRRCGGPEHGVWQRFRMRTWRIQHAIIPPYGKRVPKQIGNQHFLNHGSYPVADMVKHPQHQNAARHKSGFVIGIRLPARRPCYGRFSWLRRAPRRHA